MYILRSTDLVVNEHKALNIVNLCLYLITDEFPESLMILRLAGNPFIRHMPSYVHLFFERLPNLVQVDHFRRAQTLSYEDDETSDDAEKGGALRSTRSPSLSSAVYSPRSHYVELEMEVELSQILLAMASPTSSSSASAARATEVDSEVDVLLDDFDLSVYEQQRSQRMANWKQQLKNMETRKVELGVGDGGSGDGSENASAAAASLHSKTLERARAATKSAIADSISHFQQVCELCFYDWGYGY